MYIFIYMCVWTLHYSCTGMHQRTNQWSLRSKYRTASVKKEGSRHERV